MGIKLTTKRGEWKRTREYLKKLKKQDYMRILKECGQQGVDALSAATPKNTGLTASSWSYEIKYTDAGITITWLNHNLANGWFNVAIMLQYGHGTRNGGYVKGRDYINPALQPVFDSISETVWKVIKDDA